MAYELPDTGDDDILTQRQIARLLADYEAQQTPEADFGNVKSRSSKRFLPGQINTLPTFENVERGFETRDRKPITPISNPIGEIFQPTPKRNVYDPISPGRIETGGPLEKQRSWADKLLGVGRQAYESLASGSGPLEQFLNLEEQYQNKPMTDAPPPPAQAAAATPAGTSAIPGARRAAAAGGGAGGGGGRAGVVLTAAGGAAPGGTTGTLPDVVSQQDAAWNDYMKAIAERRKGIYGELETANKPPDYTKLQEQMRQRGYAGSDQMVAAAMMGLAPQEMQGLQESMLKRADQMRAAQKIEGGAVTAEGEVILDPMYQALKKKEVLEKRLEALDKAERSAIDARDKNEIRRQQILTEERWREADRQTKMMLGVLAASVRGKRDGDGDGGGNYDQLPKGATNEEKKQYAATRTLLDLAPNLLAEVKKNPNAFGMQIGLAQAAGQVAGVGQSQVPMLGVKLSDKEGVVRAKVFKDYAAIMHELIGTAQTDTEARRLISFIPPAGASADEVAKSLQAAIQDAVTRRGSLRKAYNKPPENYSGFLGGGGGMSPNAAQYLP